MLAAVLAAIEINDLGVCLAVGETLRVESPGYALLTPRGVQVGRTAYERASLQPRDIHNRFWHELGSEPLERPVAQVHTVADLAGLHLAEVWRAGGSDVEEVVLVVPGSFCDRQLGLLLGIAARIGLPVIGLVEAALAASREPRPRRTLLHLDVELHAATVTSLEQGTRLRRVATRSVDGLGWLAFEARWMTRVAARFVRETRFDPLHAGETERRLRDRLPAWLQALSQDVRIGVELISLDGRAHHIELDRAVFADAAQRLNERLAALVAGHLAGGPAVVQVSHRLAHLAGLQETLQSVGDVEVVMLERGAAALGALARAEQLRGRTANALTESLPWLAPPRLTPPRTPPPTSSPGRVAPTHLLHGGLATRLAPGRLRIAAELAPGESGIVVAANGAQGCAACDVEVAASGVMLHPHGGEVTLNGEAVSQSRPLGVGDCIRLDGVTEGVHVIAVPGHEA